jgi:hypothetical protein
MPDFKTIANFRKDNGKAIRSVCRQFVVLCQQLGLFTDALVAIDGSKFKAVNNRDRNFTSATLQSLAAFLHTLGRDMTAQMAENRIKMQQALANMPPEQRKAMMAVMPTQSADGSTRICISPAMAARDKPMVDPTGRCQPAKVTRNGNKSSFEFNCSTNGITTVGKGESTVSGDAVSTLVDSTTTDTRGSHTVHMESQMKYLGSDCQGVKTVEELAKSAQSLPRQK